MSASHDNPNRWLDVELRNVPLPEGLLDRLREIAAGDDVQLDAALCDVRLPDGLLARLKAIPADEALDKRLRRVAVPSALTAALRQISSCSDAALDAMLEDVAVPGDLVESLRAIARREPAHPTRWVAVARRWVVAAALLIAVGTLYWGTGVALVAAIYRVPAASPTSVLTSRQWEVRREPPVPELAFLLPQPDDAADVAAAAGEPISVFDPPAVPLGDTGLFAEVSRLFASDNPAAVDPLMDVFMTRELIAKPADETLAEVEVVDLPAARGAQPPRVKEFDLLSLIRDGANPFVVPEAHPDLAVSHVPLVTSDESFDLTRRLLGEGKLPAPNDIRVEEFLSGIDYSFPLPSERALGLRTAAGPSPFGEAGMRLLQIGVQAGRGDDADRPPTHLTLLVDTSASMGRGAQLDQVRRGLLRLAKQVGRHDRISLVIFSEHADVLLEQADRDALRAAFPLIETLQASGPANVGAGLHEALQVARSSRRQQPEPAQRVVLLTDGLGDLPSSIIEQLHGLIADNLTGGIELSVVDVASSPTPDVRLERLARTGGGALRQAAGAEAIRCSLMEILSGRPQRVARDARLTVTFNPASVARYRLLGHEPEAGLLTGDLAAELSAGQTASALYEVELKPGGGNDVAVAELVWIDPTSGEKNRVVQKISRLQFATSLLESPLSLQQAALAAEAAEVLRGSPFAPSSQAAALRQILSVAEQLSPRARQEPSVVELRMMLEQAQRIRAGKPAPRGGPQLWWWSATAR